MLSKQKLLITHSLLNSWDYLYKASDEWYSLAYESFITTLNRIDTDPTQAMLHGLAFERLVSDIVTGKPVDLSHEWIIGATEIADIIKQNCTLEQAKVQKDITVNGIDYLLYGVLDWLGSGIIYDVKFKENISNYAVGHYYDGTQHRMYLTLVGGADTFVYLVSNGKKVYQETYTRQECRPIEQTISDFEKWLKLYDLWGVYTEKWSAC